MPIATLPVVGTMNLMGGGTNWFALSVLALAIIAGALAFRANERDVIFPGAAIAVMLIYRFGMLQWHISEMRSQLDELKDNPFAGIAEAAMGGVQLQWGWLVLAAGAAAIIYAGVQARKAEEIGVFARPDSNATKTAALSAVLMLAVLGYEMVLMATAMTSDGAAPLSSDPTSTAATPVDAQAVQASREQAEYIAKYLKVYDLRARYFDSMLDGRVPGVEFKIKNNGNRTLNKVTVRVVFQDKEGRPIAEEEYYPVLVTSSGFGDDNTPLRPNYIWQQESGKFYSAKKVPNEWEPGRATATITEIEFADAAE
ncbi:MAG: hypothetical protein CMN61_03345 [Sphingobium sp.]|nr:hypothetical protein [Sphingobium sp.]